MTSLTLALMAVAASPVIAQQRDNGAIVTKGLLGQKVTPDDFQIIHASEFKSAHRVAIAVFNDAFPNTNHFTARTNGHAGRISS